MPPVPWGRVRATAPLGCSPLPPPPSLPLITPSSIHMQWALHSPHPNAPACVPGTTVQAPRIIFMRPFAPYFEGKPSGLNPPSIIRATDKFQVSHDHHGHKVITLHGLPKRQCQRTHREQQCFWRVRFNGLKARVRRSMRRRGCARACVCHCARVCRPTWDCHQQAASPRRWRQLLNCRHPCGPPWVCFVPGREESPGRRLRLGPIPHSSHS